MSFDLRIRFVGLMMWVPQGTTAMHVLMPTTEGHKHGGERGSEGGGAHRHEHDPHDHDGVPGGPTPSVTDLARAATDAVAAAAAGKNTIEQHHVRLVYDTAYLDATKTQLSREWMMVKLENRVLDLTGLTSTETFETYLPDELASLDPFAVPVKLTLVEQVPPAPPVVARVTMKAGALSDYELGAPFTFHNPEKPQRITSVTEWTIRGIASPSELDKVVIRGPGADETLGLPKLYPIGQTIHLTIYHMVGKEYPPHNLRYIPEAAGDDEHFDAYFEVAKPRTSTVPKPPKKSAGRELIVRGDEVKGDGKRDPGSICGQAKATLE